MQDKKIEIDPQILINELLDQIKKLSLENAILQTKLKKTNKILSMPTKTENFTQKTNEMIQNE